MTCLPAPPDGGPVTVPCQLCKRTDAEPREVWIEVGRVQLGVRAQLCPSCYATAPETIRRELSGPMVRSLLAVAGARLSFLGGVGTVAAPDPPRVHPRDR